MNIKLCWNEWLETGRIKPGYAFYWDELRSKGLVELPKRSTQAALKMAERRNEEECKLSPFDRVASAPDKEYLRTVYYRIVMEEYFKKWKDEGKTLLEKITHKRAS
jgi:cyclopropane fatty-acyl-phospholipid synthase-like methyltransferase